MEGGSKEELLFVSCGVGIEVLFMFVKFSRW